MSASRGDAVLDVAGPAAPPRRNGELAFEAPWESRVFGVAVALHAAGAFAWDEFRARLIAAIAAREREPGWSYWTCWLAALEDVVATKGLCGLTELDARADALARRPAGHDHGTA